MTAPASPPTPLKTNVYVDGFNLYYGCLKGTRYKWLNVLDLCRLSLPAHYHINRIRYFTALVRPRPSNPQQGARQMIFIRALQTLPMLTTHYGNFLESQVRMPLVNPRHITVLSPRGKSRKLSQVATRFRQIDPKNLAASQFPNSFPDAHGIITKPAMW